MTNQPLIDPIYGAQILYTALKHDPCSCGSVAAVVKASATKTHSAELRCAACEKFLSWAPRYIVHSLIDHAAKNGRQKGVLRPCITWVEG